MIQAGQFAIQNATVSRGRMPIAARAVAILLFASPSDAKLALPWSHAPATAGPVAVARISRSPIRVPPKEAFADIALILCYGRCGIRDASVSPGDQSVTAGRTRYARHPHVAAGPRRRGDDRT